MMYHEACELLGFDVYDDITESMLVSVFRKAAIHEHPDKSVHDDATHRFQRLQEAFDLIMQQINIGETGGYASPYAKDQSYYDGYDDEGFEGDEEKQQQWYSDEEHYNSDGDQVPFESETTSEVLLIKMYEFESDNSIEDRQLLLLCN